jgi:uncharacterized protein
VGEIEFYLDTSFVVGLLMPETVSQRAERFIRSHPEIYFVSNFAAAEFASAVSRRVRMREIPTDEGRMILATFDSWMTTVGTEVEISAADVASATGFLRRLDLQLRAPDAIHIAVARRIGATLVSFDRRMVGNAGALGLDVADPS